MKKIFLVFALFMGLASQAQIINPSNVLISAGSGAAIDPVAVDVDQLSDLTSAGNANKHLYITTNLTATANITLPSGAELIGMGGVLDLNGFTLQFTNGDIKSGSTDQFININGGSISASSTFKRKVNVALDWFGIVGDYDWVNFTGTDNREEFIEGQKIAHLSGGDIYILEPGNYAYSVIADPVNRKSVPTNFYLTGTTSLYMGNGVKIGITSTIGTTVNDGTILYIYDCDECGTYGGEIVGDARAHDYTANTGSGKKGIVISGYNKGVTIETPIRDTPGSAIAGGYAPEFIIYNTILEANFTKDFDISEVDGTASADDRFAYSDRYNITDPDFDLNGIAFGGSSFAGYRGLDAGVCQFVFYDNTSSDLNTTDGFIGKTDVVYMLDPAYVPPEATHVRVVVPTPDNWADLASLTIYSPNHSERVKIRSEYLKRGRFQGISNPPPGSIIEDITFEQNGRSFDGPYELGTTGSPGYGIDIEDGYQNLLRYIIRDNFWRNNKGGDIILKATRNAIITGNHFEPNDYFGFVNVNSISIGGGYFTQFFGNTVFDRTISVGRWNNVHNNELYDVTFEINNEYSTIHDHYMARNVRFGGGLGKSDTGFTYITNNYWLYDKPLSINAVIGGDTDRVIWKNNTFDGQGQTFGSTSRKTSTVASVDTGTAEGFIDGYYIKNWAYESGLETSARWAFYIYDIKNLESNININISRGSPRDATLENWKIQGNLYFQLFDYPSTDGVSDTFTTITVKNFQQTITDAAVISTTDPAIEVPAKDINLVFDGGFQDLSGLGDVSDGDLFFDFNHYGYLTFKNFTFKSAETGASIDSTDISGELAYFIDCEFDGVTLNEGAKIKRLFTKPHPDMETYADNAAATAGGIPEGYMYRTSTGDVKVVY